jgi:hypothetical protein
MSNPDIDRLLAAHADIAPSSSFTASVMHGVRQTTRAPRAIQFPWIAAAPAIAGMLFAAYCLLVKFIFILKAASHAGAGRSLSATLQILARQALDSGLVWMIACAVLSSIAVVWSFHLARVRF